MNSCRNSIRWSILITLAVGASLAQPIGGPIPVSGEYDDIPQDRLTDILKKQQQIAFWGERIHTHISNDPEKEDTVYRQRVLHIPPSEYRIDYLDLPDEREWHVLAQGDKLYKWGDGDTVWVSERSEVQTLGLVITSTYLDLLRQNYSVDARKGPRVADRSTFAVTVKPLHPGRPFLKAWVDSAFGVPLKLEIYDSRERLVRRFEYRRIRIGRRLRNNLETFPVPEGDLIERRSWGTEFATPEELTRETGKQPPVADLLPAGFTLTRILYGSRRDRDFIQCFYSDGYASFSLFAMENSRRAPEGREKPGIRGVRSGRRRDYSYASGWIGITQITVMGDIAESELLEVLSSVRQHNPD